MKTLPVPSPKPQSVVGSAIFQGSQSRSDLPLRAGRRGPLLIEAAGMKWDSPRGTIAIDPDTRDVVQTVYIRRVEKVGGAPQNVIIDRIENVKDPVLARLKK